MPSDEQIKHMAERFLNWKLPDPWHPDGGISFQPEYNVEHMAKQGLPPMRHEPTGTNLFDYTQAMAVVRHMVEGLPEPATPAGDDADLLDEIAEAISDTLDMDWQPSWAAPNILALINRERAAAHAAGRAEERADVVAWLRTEAGRIDDLNRHVDTHLFADAIERGQHKEPKP
jgi:hypothetical protein